MEPIFDASSVTDNTDKTRDFSGAKGGERDKKKLRSRSFSGRSVSVFEIKRFALEKRGERLRGNYVHCGVQPGMGL